MKQTVDIRYINSSVFYVTIISFWHVQRNKMRAAQRITKNIILVSISNSNSISTIKPKTYNFQNFTKYNN